jgi:chromosome segregation ATPase
MPRDWENEDLPKDWLTAAQVIWELHQEIEKLKDDLHQEGLRIEEYRDKEDEHQRQIHAREQAYIQCENYLHGSEYKRDELAREIVALKEKVAAQRTGR